MAEDKGLTLIILGIVSIIAIIGLILLFTQFSNTGAVITQSGCNSPATPVMGMPGANTEVLQLYYQAGFECVGGNVDAYNMETWCCTPPSNVPVNQHYAAGEAPMTDVSYYGYAGYRNTLSPNMG